jgi:hypothetical protein
MKHFILLPVIIGVAVLILRTNSSLEPELPKRV